VEVPGGDGGSREDGEGDAVEVNAAGGELTIDRTAVPAPEAQPA
jgi:hypothetical protein